MLREALGYARLHFRNDGVPLNYASGIAPPDGASPRYRGRPEGQDLRGPAGRPTETSKAVRSGGLRRCVQRPRARATAGSASGRGMRVSDPVASAGAMAAGDVGGIGEPTAVVFPGKVGPAARRIANEADIEDVIELMRLNYDRVVAR